MAYRFDCRHCGSKFSLEQQKDAHEAECGKVGSAPEGGETKPKSDPRPCKYCGQVFTNFGEYGKHRWDVHREEVLAELAKKREARKADEKKIDAAIKINGHGAGAAPPPSVKRSRARPEHAPGNGQSCPMCGGPVPEATAQLVAELMHEGITEAQAFTAARIARRVLATAGAN